MIMKCVVLALFIIAVFLTWAYNKKHRIAVSTRYVFAGLAVLTIVSSYPLLVGYTFFGHDFYFHVTRIEGIFQGLQTGQFPVRINPAFYFGYGYANPILYGETLLYIPALLRMMGVSLTKAYNAYALMVNMLTCFGAYWSFSRIFKNKPAGMAATILYVMSPYRIMDVYERQAMGEYTAMAFLPILLYGMYRIYTEDTDKPGYPYSFMIVAVGLSGVIQSNTNATFICAIFIVLACILLAKRTFQKKRFLELAKSAGATVLLSAWFLVPFADYYLAKDLRVLQEMGGKLKSTGVNLAQLMNLFHDYSWEDMPLSLGLPMALGMSLALTMLFIPVKETGGEEHGIRRSTVFFLIIGGLAAWMATVYFPWDFLTAKLGKFGSIFNAIEFTWRYLTPACLFAAAATGCGLLLLSRREGKQIAVGAGGVLCLLACISSVYFMQQCLDVWEEPIVINDIEEVDTWYAAIDDEFVDAELDVNVVHSVREPRPSEGVTVTNYEKKGTNVSFQADTDGRDGYVLLPLMWFRGYSASSDDGRITRANLSKGPAAVLKVEIPGGFSGRVRVGFQGFWYWRLAEMISLSSFAAGIVLYLNYRKNGKKNRS